MTEHTLTGKTAFIGGGSKEIDSPFARELAARHIHATSISLDGGDSTGHTLNP